ncbi:MAG: DUF4197 domain-containing protein [Bdellovibrionales bacterium]
MKYFITFVLCCIMLSSCQTSGTSNNNDNNSGIFGNLGGTIGSGGSGVFAGLGVDLGNIMAGKTSLTSLSNTDIIQGLKEALNIGSTNVVSQLGTLNGFNTDPTIRIPLPDTLSKVDSALSTIGMNTLTSDLETRLNRAAEAATPKAKKLFISAIQNMTIDDARGILNGPNDAATQYLRRAMGPQLLNDIEPIIQSTLQSAGAIQAYDRVIGRYEQLPFVSSLVGASKSQLESYVADKTLDGVFYYVAQEEAAIRANPAKRTTEILQKVFGTVR